MKRRGPVHLPRHLHLAGVLLPMFLIAGSLKAAGSGRDIVDDPARMKVYAQIEQINAKRADHQVALRKAEKAKDANAAKSSKAGLETERAKLKEVTKQLQAFKKKPETKPAPK